MKKILYTFALFASVLSARADLNVEWLDDNTIVVSGIGDGFVVTNVVTNAYGSCTNCVNISPDQLRAYKSSIIDECDLTDADLTGIITASSHIYNRMVDLQNDIGTFQRFLQIPVTSSSSQSNYIEFTNYVYGVDNTQTSLDRSHRPASGASQAQPRAQWMSYNNGIYDYATDYILPICTSTQNDSADIIYQAQEAQSHVAYIRTIVNSMSEEPCECSGSCSNSNCSASGDCPCAEQMDSILDYVKHIDDDFHVQLDSMADVTNFIPRMDSYAKLVSGVLYNGGTIVVDDGENSWSKVYRRGESDLYDYNKSNILQRIELLLYGLVSNTSTNWGTATSDVSSDVSNLQDTIEDARSFVSDVNLEYTDEITTVYRKFIALFNALNFFGAGSLGNFAYGEPMQFDVYDFQFDFTHAADLRPLQQVCRTAMQVFYWTAGVVFLLVFWYRVVKFTTGFALRVIHFFNNLLT